MAHHNSPHQQHDEGPDDGDLASQVSIVSDEDETLPRRADDNRQASPRATTSPDSHHGLLVPLDVVNEALDKIGMTRYHWGLFILCGCGWLADNATLQAMAIILPQVQLEFGVPNSISGLGTTASFIGMIVGASCWGIFSDIYGRRPAFNLTLLLTSIFAIISAFSPSFPALCVLLAFMGFGLGGNLPCDGTLFLEFLPAKNQKLLTLLSAFWPIGQVVISLAGWALMPGHSCETTETCSSESNRGWRYVLFALGVMIGLMFVCRFFVFRLLESPKYLLSRGKRQEALDVLNQLAQKANVQLGLTMEDLPKLRTDDDDLSALGKREKVIRRRTVKASLWQVIRAQLSEYTPSNIRPLFSKAMARTTVLVWLIWVLVAVGYTMFSGFLPKFLSLHGDDGARSVSVVYRDYLIVSVAGVPGSVLGMYLIETRIGRRGTMALSAIGTAAGFFLFTTTATEAGQLGVSCLSACLANVMYGVIYTYTPEVFAARVRGTGTGIASALGRITGSTAPILSGVLLNISLNIPLYVAAACLVASAACAPNISLHQKHQILLYIDREAEFHSLKLFVVYLYVKSKHCFISTEKLTQILYKNTTMGINYFWKYLASLNVIEKKLGSVDFKREFGVTDNTTPKRVPGGLQGADREGH
ncbi:hypothetical protein SeLEV6574_g03938 [Synchytrium endobioticum]|uniref:Major facilitator superfamily (MFS) profile domain-containing protein n=1 Tax=Synchytrium endobioticum TaxID=286115 RepID=A0A507D1G8_9FUNG|nr:hypothetical protein SeLEV6574_g03938 [Synchytrium endobioticum]